MYLHHFKEMEVRTIVIMLGQSWFSEVILFRKWLGENKRYPVTHLIVEYLLIEKKSYVRKKQNNTCKWRYPYTWTWSL